MPKCSCRRIAPRCLYCLEDKRRRNKAAYTTEGRREKEKRAVATRLKRKHLRQRERDASKVGSTVRYGEMGIAYANKILSRPCPSTSITWEHISAGRSNS